MEERFLMEEMLEQMKKHNEIQERIEREMETQNNLMSCDMVENKENFIFDIEEEIKSSVYEDLRQKSDVKNSGGRFDVFRLNSKGGYLNSNINKVINAMFDGFEKSTRNEGMTSLIDLLVWYVRNNKMTNHNARRIVMEVAKNSEPPMDIGELSTIWNSAVSRVNNE